MMKYLSKNIKYVGFDMDGTLYDEFEFISQVYKSISIQFKSENAYSYMCNRWLLKGSSYNKIFDETYDKFELKIVQKKEDFIDEALDLFRNFNPVLSLSDRVAYLLNFYKENFTLFLITDGNPILQEKKFLSLELNKYFDFNNVIFTGKYTNEYHKPNINALSLLDIEPQHSIFFGDRDIDCNFAKSANIKFERVYNMVNTI